MEQQFNDIDNFEQQLVTSGESETKCLLSTLFIKGMSLLIKYNKICLEGTPQYPRESVPT